MNELLQKLTATKRVNKPITKPHILKHVFQEMGILNKRLAEELGVDAVYISKWLNGQAPVPEDKNKQLHELARAIKLG
jgi:plasmid maintenance system antidote protein VapI